MEKDLGASQATGLAGAEAPEPHSRLGPAGGIPCAWQPIETAPKKEAVFLAWDGFSVFEAYWYGDYAVTAQSLSPRPWVSHWMPLPAPPAA